LTRSLVDLKEVWSIFLPYSILRERI
jgi:hypothetical protein